MSTLEQALRAANPFDGPHVAGNVDVLLSGEPSERASWALHALISGITATPIPDSTITPR